MDVEGGKWFWRFWVEFLSHYYSSHQISSKENKKGNRKHIERERGKRERLMCPV
jgi:hypothetical protein